jgi:uncharacterized membrane protein HdeD (DUF308 family)
MTMLISGAIIAAYAIAGLFFLRFWTETADRLFGIFAIAFWMLGVQRLLLALQLDPTDGHVWVYLLRLLAFVLILGAIVDKNRAGR